MKVLAIDPGFDKVGFAIFDKNVAAKSFQYIDSGLIKTAPAASLPERLKYIHNKLLDIITLHQPACIVMEQIFFFKNQKTVIRVAQAQGAILLLGSLHNIEVSFLTPLQIKQIVTGYGTADKVAVQKMVRLSLPQAVDIADDDQSDAIACGLAYCYLQKNLVS